MIHWTNRKVYLFERDPTYVRGFHLFITAVEIAIKTAIGKLEAPESLWSEIHARGLRELPLRYVHGERLRALPLHHSDPFDRLLIAQAEEENLTIITHDKKFAAYEAKVLWT